MIPVTYELALGFIFVQWAATADVPRNTPGLFHLMSLYYGLATVFGLPLFIVFEFAKWRRASAYFLVGFIAGYLLGMAWTALTFWEVGEIILSPAILRVASIYLECLFGLAVGLSAVTFRRLAIDWDPEDQPTQASAAQ